MSTWAITCDRWRLGPGPTEGAMLSGGDELRGKEPRGDLQGDRPAQLELPVPGQRGPHEPLRVRAPRLGGDPRPADRPRRDLGTGAFRIICSRDQEGEGIEEAEALGIPIEVAVPSGPPEKHPRRSSSRAAARRRRCSRASGWSAPSSVKIATITRRSWSLRSGSCSDPRARPAAARAPRSESPSSQAAERLLKLVRPRRRSGRPRARRGRRDRRRRSRGGRCAAVSSASLVLAPAEQDPAQPDRGPSVPRIELERLAQRLLVAGLRQPVRLRGDDLVEERLDPRGRHGADELGDDLAVLERLDGGDAGDLELLRDVRDCGRCRPWRARFRRSACGHGLLEGGAQSAARPAPLGPEVDDHRHLLGALDDLGLELLL